MSLGMSYLQGSWKHNTLKSFSSQFLSTKFVTNINIHKCYPGINKNRENGKLGTEREREREVDSTMNI